MRAESGGEAQLGRQLFEAVRLGIWRARSVVDFEAFAMHVLGIEPARATELAKSGAAEASLELERLPDGRLRLTYGLAAFMPTRED